MLFFIWRDKFRGVAIYHHLIMECVSLILWSDLKCKKPVTQTKNIMFLNEGDSIYLTCWQIERERENALKIPFDSGITSSIFYKVAKYKYTNFKLKQFLHWIASNRSYEVELFDRIKEICKKSDIWLVNFNQSICKLEMFIYAGAHTYICPKIDKL